MRLKPQRSKYFRAKQLFEILSATSFLTLICIHHINIRNKAIKFIKVITISAQDTSFTFALFRKFRKISSLNLWLVKNFAQDLFWKAFDALDKLLIHTEFALSGITSNYEPNIDQNQRRQNEVKENIRKSSS